MEISKRQYTHLLHLMESKGMKSFFPSQNSILKKEKDILPSNKVYATKFKAEIDVEFAILSTLKSVLNAKRFDLNSLLSISEVPNFEFCIKLGNYLFIHLYLFSKD